MDSDQLIIAKFEYILSGDLPEEITIESVKQLIRDATNEWLENVDHNEFFLIKCQKTILQLKTQPLSDNLSRKIVQEEFLGVLETFISEVKGIIVH